MPAERVCLVGAERLLDQLLGAAAAGLARQVDLLAASAALEAEADGLRRARGSAPPRKRHLLLLVRLAPRGCGWDEPQLSLARCGSDREEELLEQPGERARVGAASAGRARAAGPRRWARARARPSQGSQASSAKRRSASCPGRICSSVLLAAAPGPPTPLRATRSRSGGMPSASSASSWARPARSCSSRAPRTSRTASAATTASRWTRQAGPASSPSARRKPRSQTVSG